MFLEGIELAILGEECNLLFLGEEGSMMFTNRGMKLSVCNGELGVFKGRGMELGVF